MLDLIRTLASKPSVVNLTEIVKQLLNPTEKYNRLNEQRKKFKSLFLMNTYITH